MILADASQLGHALVNLAVNGRDAMPQGGRLTIDTAQRRGRRRLRGAASDLAPGRYVRLRVTDTGIGMPPDVVEHAFDPFFTTKPFGEGTGLASPPSTGSSPRAGGHAHFYSEPGIGTTFVALFPVIDAPSARRSIARPSPSPGRRRSCWSRTRRPFAR